VLGREGLADPDDASHQGDVAFVLDAADEIVRSVGKGFGGVAKGSRRGRVVVDRHAAGQRVVRPLEVVDVAPGVEGGLRLGQVGERPAQRFGGERPVEALVLAERLGVARPRMAERDAGFDQPDAELGEAGAMAGVAPGRTVVDRHAPGQAIAAESLDQQGFDGRAGLVGAGLQRHRETRMIVQHRQRMQPAVEQRHMALEVHLPQIVRRFVLETDERMSPAAMLAQFDAVALENAGHRRGCDRSNAVSLHHSGDLAPTPDRMLGANGKNRGLHRRRTTLRRDQRPAASAPQGRARPAPDSARSACSRRSDRSRNGRKAR
jgi:hypothetical protein